MYGRTAWFLAYKYWSSDNLQKYSHTHKQHKSDMKNAI